MSEEWNYPSKKYEEAVKQLLKNIEKLDTLALIRAQFKKFSKKYTVIPELWEYWLDKEKTVTYKDYNESKVSNQIKKVKNLAKMDYYNYLCLEYRYPTFTQGNFGRAFMWNTTNHFSVTRKRMATTFNPFSTEVLFQLFMFPHDKLEDAYRYAKKYSTYPIPSKIRQKYKASKKLFYEIVAHGAKASKEEKDERNRSECFIAAGLEYLQKTIVEKLIVIENYESAIGIFSCSKMLWKMYINYLKSKKEYKRLLNLYSHIYIEETVETPLLVSNIKITNIVYFSEIFSFYFCRLFIDDEEVKEEYRKEMEQQKNVTIKKLGKWWIDTIEFEKDFFGIDSARIVLERALVCCKEKILIKYGLWFEKEYGTIQHYMTRYLWSISIYPSLAHLHIISKPLQNIKTKIEFRYKNSFQFIDIPKYCTPRNLEPSAPQMFSFCDGIIWYILKSASPPNKLKLFMSAKYFYLKENSLICHNLTILNGQEYDSIFFPHSVFINHTFVDFPLLKNLTVSNALIIHAEGKPKILSTLLPKLNFNISHLVLMDQNLSLSEFKIISTLNLKSVSFDKIVISDSDNGCLSIDKIISMLNTVKDLCILHGTFVPETSKNLSQLKRCKKIKIFEISEISIPFSFEDFIEFAKENLSSYAKIIIHFSQTVTDEEKNLFEQKMKIHLSKILVSFDNND